MRFVMSISENRNHGLCTKRGNWLIVSKSQGLEKTRMSEIIDFNKLILETIHKMEKEKLTAIKTVEKIVNLDEILKVSIIIEKEEEE